jgi:2-dehydro-3-deoxygalactonokinase
VATPTLIAADWGTTSFRAYLVAANGTIMGRTASKDGILAVQDGRFEDVLRSAVSVWRAEHPGLPILMSGMIGSRQGWVEAPYVRCPAGVADIAGHLVPVPAPSLDRVWLVPGLDTRDASGRPDVMRGEEVQVLGAYALGGRLPAGESPSAIKNRSLRATKIVLPGTHSKWVTVEDGRITGFRTFMTGEVFAALKDHTILGRLMTGTAPNADGFARGVRAAAEGGGPGWLLGALFSVRSLGLFDMLPADALADYLSGLLIGSEIVEATQGSGSVGVLCAEPLLSRYLDAARLLDLPAHGVAADTIVHGHLAIARAAGLVG